MKHLPLFLTVLAVALTIIACDQRDTTSHPTGTERSADATRDMKDYTYAQRAEYTELMRRELAEISRELDQLAVKIEKSSDAAKAEAQPKLQVLRDRADGLNQQLGEAENATESTWDSVKAGTRMAYEELKEGFYQARQWVGEKITP